MAMLQIASSQSTCPSPWRGLYSGWRPDNQSPNHALRQLGLALRWLRGVAGVERGDDAAMQRGRHEGAVEAFGGEGVEIGVIAHAAADEDLGGGERSAQRPRRVEARPLTAAHPGEIEHDECSYPRSPRHRAEPG